MFFCGFKMFLCSSTKMQQAILDLAVSVDVFCGKETIQFLVLNFDQYNTYDN